MFGKQPGSSIVGIATLAISMVVFAACGNGAQSDAPPVDATATAVRATVAAAATAGIVPDGLVIATSTPDLDTANRLRPSDLRERLAQYRGIAAIFARSMPTMRLPCSRPSTGRTKAAAVAVRKPAQSA